MSADFRYTLRDPDTGRLAFRTNDRDLAVKFARGLARQSLIRGMERRHDYDLRDRVDALVATILGEDHE
jgi:hypothetical protein